MSQTNNCEDLSMFFSVPGTLGNIFNSLLFESLHSCERQVLLFPLFTAEEPGGQPDSKGKGQGLDQPGFLEGFPELETSS